jgi:membrane protein DedA with SNARE-associated domain
MTTSVYPINKGVNRPIEFHGLKGQYILYAGGILAGDLIFFCILYISGLNSWICLLIVACGGAFGIWTVFRLSRRYGEFGLLKKRALKSIPRAIRSRTRKVFTQLKKSS